MTIRRMDNVGIVVNDLDAAIAFFGELGMAPRQLESAVAVRCSHHLDVAADASSPTVRSAQRPRSAPGPPAPHPRGGRRRDRATRRTMRDLPVVGQALSDGMVSVVITSSALTGLSGTTVTRARARTSRPR